MKAKGLDLLHTSGGKWLLQVEISPDLVAHAKSLIDKFFGKEINLIIEAFRNHRSRAANNYCWALIDKLAIEVGEPSLDVYRHYIREVGVCKVFDISENAIDTFEHSWKMHGDGWVCDVLDYGQVEGFRTIHAFFGSSTYNTAQMSRLIDSIVEDCKKYGIETRTPDEIAIMKEKWKPDAVKGDKSA